MPTYQYKCKRCEHRFDISQRITEDPLTTCPECAGEIRRVLFPAGVVFKGSGWYVTDYRSDSEKAKYKDESKSGSSESKPAEAKTDTPASDSKTETKSEPKTETKPAETKTESKTESGSGVAKAA